MKDILRLIDANFNRLLEAARVLEDSFRFLFDDPELTGVLKRVRHQTKDLKIILEKKTGRLVLSRDASGDVGRENVSSEMRRESHEQVIAANMSRLKESLRVLEEYSKIYDGDVADSFQKMRYSVYTFEAHVAALISHDSGGRISATKGMDL